MEVGQTGFSTIHCTWNLLRKNSQMLFNILLNGDNDSAWLLRRLRDPTAGTETWLLRRLRDPTAGTETFSGQDQA